MGLFSKSKNKSTITNKRLTNNYNNVLRDLKKKRVEHCQRNDVKLSQMGMDLAHIEKKSKTLFNESVKYIKSGNSHEDAYMYVLENFTVSSNDKEILNKLYISK
ncbi:hypothetical protein [Helicovermis profundi]|uniref:Uncharacterized protein n=1 Tax=Helicovermis profundi TaxID=3065157 RepID=A0AAU9EDR5_9FIRM|nr:hypothetical protein HLPR_18700 [Clostridia bacterium S502]